MDRARNKDIKPYTGKRRKLLDVLFDPDNIGDDITELCRKAKISRAIFYKYTDEPEFNKAIIEGTLKLYAKHLPQSANSLIKQAKRGNIQASKLLHQALLMVDNKGAINIGVSVEPTQATTQTYKDSQEAIEDIDKRIEELKTIRQGQVNRLEGHGIHPSDKDGSL